MFYKIRQKRGERVATLEKTIAKAIEIATPEVLKKSRLFFRLMEDLSPELSRERSELEWMYSDEIGELLFSAYGSKHGMLEPAMLDSAWKEIKDVLEQKRGLKEQKQEWFVQVFSRAFSASDLDLFYLYLNAADAGDPEAARMVGYMSENGIGTLVDTERAFTYYRKAALAGDLDAVYNLGFFYYFGVHGQKDLERAYLCFEFAANEGESMSMYALGDMYEMGKYVEKNLETALYWYEKAFRYGYQEAEKACQRVRKTISE